MRSNLHITTRVLPGNRIEITSPDLTEGEDVQVTIEPRVQAAAHPELLKFLDALPSGPRSAATWEEVERQYREERDAWDR